MHGLIIQRGKRLPDIGMLRTLLGGIAIYAMILPLLLLDVCIAAYQAVYFSINGIPKVRRKDYVLIDRSRLAKLALLQKINCMYCDYANGVIAWVKAVINTTEVYSCAIKHGSSRQGQEHQKEYFEYEDFA